MKIKKARWFFVALAVVMIVSMFAGLTGADVAENFAFIPNSGEATVSKVDLVSMQEVARYYTVDSSLNSDPYDDVNYRVARLAIDGGGNAWALNTMTGQSQNVHQGLGSVARISADPVAGEDPGNNTSNSSSVVAGDVRVTVFPLGESGQCPRTISIVEENGTTYLWIGFWNGSYFQKYEYDPDLNTLEPVVGEVINVFPATPYQAVLDNNGIMWISSRASSPFPQVNGLAGVFKFDTNDLGAGVTQLEYAPPGNEANPYAITVASDGRVWVSNGGNWNSSQIRQFAVYTYGEPDPVYCSTGIATEAMRGFIEYDGHIWATAISGQVIKGTFANGGCPTWEVVKTYPRSTAGGGLTGIGPDASGNLWVVHFDDDVLYGFNPTTLDELGPISVGSNPYAYDNFIVPADPPTYGFCGYKYVDGVPTQGWTIKLEVEVDGIFVSYEVDGVQLTATTGTDGKYCFDGLPAGTYRVTETLQDGYTQVFPDPEGENGGAHIVVLPGGETPEGTILYGTQRENSNNNGLYEINIEAGTSTRLFNAGGSGNSPNGLGFDPVNKRLYYMKVSEPNGPSNLFFYDIETNTETAAGLSLPGEVVVGASFFEGAYYYIPNLTADLHKVTLNSDGTKDEDIKLWENFNGESEAVYRFGDFAINRQGMLYASTNGTGGSTAEFFKLDVLTGEYTLIADETTPNAALLLQVSFGSDGTLYGHAAGSGEFFTIDLEAGTKSSIGYVGSDLRSKELFSDLASGFQPYDFYNEEEPEDYSVCGYKYMYGTEIGLEGWKIYLHEEELAEGDDPSVGYFDVATTDAIGKYCFNELPAGTYFIYEEVRAGFKPHPAFFEVTLPGDETDLDAEEPIFYIFENEKEKCETAWGWNDDANENWDLNGVNNWGWNLGPLGESEEAIEFELWAAAGQNDRSKGEHVGNGTIVYDAGKVTVSIGLFDGFQTNVAHLWVGDDHLPPHNRPGRYTAAPGSFNYNDYAVYDNGTVTFTITEVEGEIYVAIHLEVCWFPSDIVDAE